jgi:hypothetical protein
MGGEEVGGGRWVGREIIGGCGGCHSSLQPCGVRGRLTMLSRFCAGWGEGGCYGLLNVCLREVAKDFSMY